MTLIVETPRISYVGDGVTDTFATGFTFEKDLELTVWRGPPTVVDCCSAPTYDNLLALNVDYVILPGDWLTDGAEIQVLSHALIANGELITIMRTTPPDQPEGFGDLEEFTPEQHEFTLDRITRMIQELYNNPFGVVQLGELAYDWKAYSPDAWTDDLPFDVLPVVRGLTFKVLHNPSQAAVRVYDAAEKVLTIQKQDATVLGTITIPAGSGDVVISVPEDFSVVHGDELSIVPPVGGLGAVQGLRIVLAFEVS